MIEHATDIIPLLIWMILAVGGSLLALLVWIGSRIQSKVDEIPGQVAKKVDAVHAELLAKVDDIKKDQHNMSHDLRAELTSLDRRLVKVEVRCDMNHGAKP